MVTMREKRLYPNSSHTGIETSQRPHSNHLLLWKNVYSPKGMVGKKTPYYYFGCSFTGDNDQPLNTAQLTLSCRETENCDTKVKHDALILKANFLHFWFALQFFRLASSQQIFAYKHENLHATMAIYLQPYQSLEGTNRILIEENTFVYIQRVLQGQAKHFLMLEDLLFKRTSHCCEEA